MTKYTEYTEWLMTLMDIKIRLLEVKQNAFFSGANTALLEEFDVFIDDIEKLYAEINTTRWEASND